MAEAANGKAYPLLSQDIILSALGGATVFSRLELIEFFFQQALAL
jgi:hypothetical protein